MAERAETSKTLDFGPVLEIATIDLVLHRLFPLLCLLRSSHRPRQRSEWSDRSRAGAAGGRTIKLREAAPSTRITAAQCLCVNQSVIDLG
ncbi:hypothetical protein J6590_037172 [Homalodisca vitripennis]|nr:hypothetical protein J6590_037172 [Homalodisca vitripennis]